MPNFSNEIKEILVGKGVDEMKLAKGSLIKLSKRDREEFIPFIKQTLENPSAIARQNDNASIFIGDFNDKRYFASVSKNEKGEWIITSNAPKSLNNVKNKISEGGELLYNKLPELPIIAKPDLTDKALNIEATTKSVIPNQT